MALEIERRFRVASEAWRASVLRSTQITQGYLAITEDSVIRVRVRDTQAYLTIKSRDGGPVRQEFEYAVPLADAHALLKLCGRRILGKVRHEVIHGGYRWEIDEYLAPFQGLILAEVEMQTEYECPSLPPWIGEDITSDPGFTNAALAQRIETLAARDLPP